MITSLFHLFSTLALGAPVPQYAAPVIEALFGGAPENFRVADLHTSWRWQDDPGQLGPTASIEVALDIQLPATWELKSFKSGSAQLLEVKKQAGATGLWHLSGTMNTALATAAIEFHDERQKVFKLELTLRTKSRHPYLLIREQCPNYRVHLDPGIAHGNYLFLIVSCLEFGDDITLYFAHSPDGKWIGSNIIKNPKQLAFEYKFPKGEAGPGKHHVFDLRTEDTENRRAEYEIFVSESGSD